MQLHPGVSLSIALCLSVCLSKSLMLSIYWKLRSHRNSRFIVETVPLWVTETNTCLIYPCIHLSRAFCVLKIKVQWKYSSWQVVKWFMISVDSQMESLCITISGVDWLLKMLLTLWCARLTDCLTSVIFELTSRCNYIGLASELLDDLTAVDLVSSTSTRQIFCSCLLCVVVGGRLSTDCSQEVLHETDDQLSRHHGFTLCPGDVVRLYD